MPGTPPGRTGANPQQNFTVPYPAAVGSAGPTVDLTQLMSGGAQVLNQAGQLVSGAWIELINDSDSMLYCAFDVGPAFLPIPPSWARSFPIPVAASKITTQIPYQNAVQSRPNETLTATFFQPSDIHTGYVPLQGPLNNPTPATALGPGPLPEGVTIGADNVGTAAPSEFLGPFTQITAAAVGAAAAPDVMNLVDMITIVTAALKVLYSGTFPNLPGAGTVQDLIRFLLTGDTGPSRLSAGIRADGFGFLQSSDQTVPNRSRLWGSVTGWQTDAGLTVAGSVSAGELLASLAGVPNALLDLQTTGAGATHFQLFISAVSSLRILDAAANHFFFEFKSGQNIISGANLTLATGVQETGVCGCSSGIATGPGTTQPFSVGVSFRQDMTNVPGSITLTTIASANVSSGPTASNIGVHGFQLNVTFNNIGSAFWFGTYATVGN